MRILLTNDDGINAPGLAVAEAVAEEIAGPGGEVWVIAPDVERSGVSHCISYVQPTRLVEIAPRRWMLDGFPADCVLVGLTKLMSDEPPDLIISGVNRGHNVAEDVLYSGTVGGAMEGGLNRIPAVALSQFFRKAPHGPEDMWASARAKGAEVLRAVLRMPFDDTVFYNVNFPACAPEDVKGVTVCPQGMREEATFEVVDYTAPNGRNFQFLRHTIANHSAAHGSDARMLVDDWVTITPLRPQLTAEDLLDQARAALRPGAVAEPERVD
jgi:5'-nucleotidase